MTTLIAFWAQQLLPAQQAPFFDFTIHMSDVVLFMGGLVAFLKLFVMTRDQLRDVIKVLGQLHPPEGLVGDIADIKRQTQAHRDALHDAGWLDRRSIDRRKYEAN